MTYKRTDANQTAIVRAFRDLGASVQVLSAVGHGCPDLIVGYRCINILVEVKDGSKPFSQQKLTLDEQKFFNKWRGQVAIVRSVDDVVKIINSLSK